MDLISAPIHDGNRDCGLVQVHPDILLLTHKGAPFARLVMRLISTYRKSGAIFRRSGLETALKTKEGPGSVS